MVDELICKSCEGCDMKEEMLTKLEELENVFLISLKIIMCKDRILKV